MVEIICSYLIASSLTLFVGSSIYFTGSAIKRIANTLVRSVSYTLILWILIGNKHAYSILLTGFIFFLFGLFVAKIRKWIKKIWGQAENILRVSSLYPFFVVWSLCAVIMICSGYIKNIDSIIEIQKYVLLNLKSILLVVSGLILSTSPANALIRILLFNLKLPAVEGKLQAGAKIGSLERIIIFVLILLGKYDVIGFIIASKSLLRFKESDTQNSEYLLAGTLLSFTIVFFIGVTVRLLL
jgi:hypothetical protein